MEKEYNSISGTTANRLEILKNKGNAAGITLGNILLPSIIEMADSAGNAVDKIGAFAEKSSVAFSMPSPKFPEPSGHFSAVAIHGNPFHHILDTSVFSSCWFLPFADLKKETLFQLCQKRSLWLYYKILV